MAYKNINELPDTFDKLPEAAKKMAMEVMNSCLKDGDSEESAIKQAWGAIKKSYKQDKDGNWVAMEDKHELETVDIPNVEILAVGTWQGNKKVTIPKEAIPAFVESFDELTGNKKLNYEPPLKLGHDDKQKLLQTDGYPAAGWIGSLKGKGEKLVAGFVKVPKQLGELIKAGAYKKVSAEFYQDYEIGGKKYPWVLKAVSLLGADVPAVKTIQDIQALYSEQNEPEPVIILAELGEDMSLDNRANLVREAYYAQTRNPLTTERDSWICEVFVDHVILDRAGKMYRVPYAETADGISFALESAIAVKKEINYVPIKAAEVPAAAASHIMQNLETEVLMEAELRKLLKLDEKADVLAAVKALVDKPEAVSLAEYTATKSEVTKLTERIALKERDERVKSAMDAGKVSPAMKPWAEKFALSDPAGFDTWVKEAPRIIQLGEKGVEGGEPAEVQLTEAEMKIAALIGNSREDLIKSKQEAK